MKLNKILMGAVVAVGLSFNTSCTDLETEVYTDVLKDDYFQTTEQFATLIANAYSQLAGEYGYVYREGNWSLQQYCTDEVIVPTRGTDWYDDGVPQDMHRHNWTDNFRDVNNGWSFAYGGVGKCNDILNTIVEIKGEDESEYDEITLAGIAETKTLRAFYHLLAMDLYGNVAIDDNVNEVKQYTRAEVFEWIEGELIESLEVLDPTVRYGSMTKSVAHMLLAKLYLNAEVYTGTARWEDCAAQCDSIINGGYGYTLNPDYFTTFAANNGENMEIIFPIVFDQVYAAGNMFHLITLHYSHQEAYGFTTATWNGPCTLESFYNSYSDDDVRKEGWFVGPILNSAGDTIIYSGSTPVDGPSIIVPEVTTIEDATAANTFEGARFVKFEIEEGIEYSANSDFPIYRYADVLLMKAEALMRINGGSATGEALELVNQVHTRAGLPAYTSLDFTELLAERGRELAWEGHRRQDLIRFDQFVEGEWFEKSASNNKNREIYPIPTWVQDAASGVYTQNDWQ